MICAMRVSREHNVGDASLLGDWYLESRSIDRPLDNTHYTFMARYGEKKNF